MTWDLQHVVNVVNPERTEERFKKKEPNYEEEDWKQMSWNWEFLNRSPESFASVIQQLTKFIFWKPIELLTWDNFDKE